MRIQYQLLWRQATIYTANSKIHGKLQNTRQTLPNTRQTPKYTANSKIHGKKNGLTSDLVSSRLELISDLGDLGDLDVTYKSVISELGVTYK